MADNFRVLIREHLLKSGLSGAKEIFESKATDNFGNSDSLWELGNLRMKFIKDRSQIFVDIGSVFDSSQFFIFDDIALMMGWQTLNEVIEAEEPLELLACLNLVKNHFDELNRVLSKKQLEFTVKKIVEISNAKTKARFS